MLKSLTSAVSGLKNHQTLMDVIGNNIANVDSSGFRSSRVVFSDVYYQTLSSASGASGSEGGKNAEQVGYGSAVSSVYVLNDGSSYTQTGRSKDLYIDGDGYFVETDTAGNTVYSKLGNFYFDSSGNLTDAKGNRVCDDTGSEINISDLSNYSDISFSSSGEITGVDTSTGTTTDLLGGNKIGLAYFANSDGLTQDGNGYYKESLNSGTAQLTTAGTGTVGTLVSGALESSNVDLTNEFTNMIVAERGYQANARVITTSDEILQELVGLKR
jgi:flagellar hook protein FlgE